MARVLITGADGFTGQYLVERLSRDGHDIFGLAHHHDTKSQYLRQTRVADLRDLSALTAIVSEIRPERVVHLAAVSNVAHLDVSEIYSSNIVGTRNLLHALSTIGPTPAAVLIAGSANIYGNRYEGILTEDMEPAPVNDYGVTKVACEFLARAYADRLPMITVRPFNYTGRRQSENFLIPKIVSHFRKRAASIELGNIEVARDFSDVRMVVDAYARLLEAPAAIGQVVNVCSGWARSLNDVLHLAERISGHHMEIRVNQDFVRSDEVKSLCGSRARLESIIGPVRMPDLAETIGWMLDD